MFTFWHVFVLFGVLQSLLLAVSIGLRAGANASARLLLAALLLCNAVILGEYSLVYSGLYITLPHLLGFTLPLLFLIGPLYYCYVDSLLGQGTVRHLALHTLPAALAIAVTLPFYSQSAADKVLWVKTVLTQGFSQFPMSQIFILACANFSLIAYFYHAYQRLERSAQQLINEYSGGAVLTVLWLQRLSAVFSVALVLFLMAWCEVLQAHPQFLMLPVIAFLLTALALALATLAFLQPELLTSLSQLGLPDLIEEPIAAKYEKTALSQQQRQQYRQQLLQHMTEQRPWLDCNLRLSVLAEALELPAHHLSQVINQELGQNFFEFINGYRVEAAKALLRQTAGSRTILAIALQAGFNSKASFNRIFKQQTGFTPSAYSATRE